MSDLQRETCAAIGKAAAAESGLPGLGEALEASGLAAYCWTIDSDEIAWSANAAAVLEAQPGEIGTGKSYAALLDPANVASRYDAVMRGSADAGDGAAFQIEYVIRPRGRTGPLSLWVEDQGRWFAGPDGRPQRVLGTVRRIDERHRRDQRLSYLGHSDPLTGLMNRLRMIEVLGQSMERAETEQSSCALLVASICNLTMVNEAYGFEVGDEVVVEAGCRLARVARSGDSVARYSGSKFGLILNRCGEEDLAAAAERFLRVVRENVIDTGAGPVWALLSVGAVVLPRHASEPAVAMTRAEEALVQARKQPFDGYAIYRPSPQRLSERSSNARCATAILRCLKEQRLRLAYQPVIDVRTGKPAFHEALLRIADPAGEGMPAWQLIPVAEKLGLVRLIDKAVTELVAATLAEHGQARISLNVSGTTATDPRWYPEIIAILAGNRDAASRLIVEITETVALGSDLSDTARFVRQLRDLGASVAIDDFGAGYTSFRNLRSLPVEMLKIDGALCRDLAGNADNRYFVRSLIDLARAFGLSTVAEWVENEADATLLTDWGVDMMQGELFGPADTRLPWPAAPKESQNELDTGSDGELARLREAVSVLDMTFHAAQHGAR